MTTRIAHIFPDSPFLPFTVDVFETVAPGENTFLVYAMKGELERYSISSNARMETVPPGDAGFGLVSKIVGGSDIVIAHSMGPLPASALVSAPPGALRVWSGWGADYYGSALSPMSGLLGPLTADFHRSRTSLPGKAVRLRRRLASLQSLRRAAAATDVFSAPIPDDLAIFTKRYPRFRGRYGQLNYASVEDTFAAGSHEITGDDILVGNSATLANNHFEVLEILAGLHTSDRRVIVPLSYGDRTYAQAVVSRGRDLLGSRFVPLLDFLPLEEYQGVISGCSVVVMGHRRQQGVGNIASALWNGAHVFLDERNPVSQFLRDRGAAFGTLGDLKSAGLPSGRVTQEQLAANRQLLQDFWGRGTVLGNIEALIASHRSGAATPRN